jgi:pimeloyl-ACP methyl ester carboxylesterase
MKSYRGFCWICCASLVAGAFLFSVSTACRADSVIMKNGMVYRSQGPPDKDNTLVVIWDGLKRVVVRDSKIEKINADNAFRTGEVFRLDQPIEKHGGAMPRDLISVEAGPWNQIGRRTFQFVGSRVSKLEKMEQAIIEIGPHIIKYRGIDGFWLGQVETNQVPRPIVTGLLGRVEEKNMGERERVVRFLLDVGWYAEAKKELDRLIHDFPKTDLSERAANARIFIVQAEATHRRSEIDLFRKSQQYHHVAELLKSFREKEIPTELVVEVREIERRDEQQRATDRTLAGELRQLANRLPSPSRAFWKDPLAEVLKAIEQAPDAVRDRLTAYRKALSDPSVKDEPRFALAMSGYVVGHEFAVAELKSAEVFWKARELVREYLAGLEAALRSDQAVKLESLDWPAAVAETPEMVHRLELLTRIVQLMPPPRHDDAATPEKTLSHRVKLDENDEPTDYAVRLPPEYHPLRNYPAVVVLHSGKGPNTAIDQWAAEASRRGYILIAPEYMLAGQPRDYQYTPAEHAAVELALRDARMRYAIDSDRVFLAGQLTGGNMAWDYGLAHTDSFAGAIVISGLPAKYVPRYKLHHERLPMFFVIGDLAPAANEFVFANYVKPYILKAWDITYVGYYRRGLEEFPEEIPTAFDWMERRRRDSYPKSFTVSTARTSDDRFYGVVVKEFRPENIVAPKLDDVLGQSLNPATIEMKSSSVANLIRLEVKGISQLDVWLSPKMIDFKRKPDVRINGRSYFTRQNKLKLDMETMLDDLRVRGDRQQLYWYRVSAR